ncbi:uncharacterized protein LOC142590165 isoform X1 [Dermacentor variabilis]|uniref:uncharacterized protein LOC142590165 isoform X1 n=1 Tax=Dermacentor variabilis TaxID=34621 RepID=UPI003F5C45EB
MANPTNPVIDASRPVGAADVSNLLANLEGARGFFSGKLIDYRMPCTAAEDRACQIVSNLTVWNEFLCQLHLELRELPETGRQLGLLQINNNCLPGPREGRLRQAATVLYWLLSIHHCVARIQIGHMIEFSEAARLCFPVLCNTLHGNSSLKAVSVHFSLAVRSVSEKIEKLSNVISSLKCLEELDASRYSFCPRSLSAILRSTTTLTVLDWSFVEHIESTLAQQFLTALRTNSTLRDLSLSVAVIRADPALFVEFLTGDVPLENLKVVSSCDCCSDDCWRWILKGMLKNQSVSSLQAVKVTLDLESVELASKVLAENRVLRRFHVSPRYYMHDTSMEGLVYLTMPPNTTALQDAIARNSTLHYLTLNFSIWSTEHWAPFFRVLSGHTSLKMATIEVGERESRLLSGVVKALQQSGAEEKVFFKGSKGPCVADEFFVPYGKYFCELQIDVTGWGTTTTLPLFQQLSTFSRLKELSLTLLMLDRKIFSALCEYIAMTTTLRKLHVTMLIGERELIDWWPALSRSLLLNKSIAQLSIDVPFGRHQNVELVGDAVMRSQTIRKLILMSFDPCALRAFLRRLRADILNNYTLCSITMKHWREFHLAADWFAVRDTSRRNSGLVARAAQLLNHARCDRLSAAALDRVSRHPALMAELVEVLSIDEDEAARMVRQRFRSIEGLHEFMRLAGVVKQRVTCRPREDGRAQLDDLNSECWCHVRRYLQLDDVAFD